MLESLSNLLSEAFISIWEYRVHVVFYIVDELKVMNLLNIVLQLCFYSIIVFSEYLSIIICDTDHVCVIHTE